MTPFALCCRLRWTVKNILEHDSWEVGLGQNTYYPVQSHCVISRGSVKFLNLIFNSNADFLDVGHLPGLQLLHLWIYLLVNSVSGEAGRFNNERH